MLCLERPARENQVSVTARLQVDVAVDRLQANQVGILFFDDLDDAAERSEAARGIIRAIAKSVQAISAAIGSGNVPTESVRNILRRIWWTPRQQVQQTSVREPTGRLKRVDTQMQNSNTSM